MLLFCLISVIQPCNVHLQDISYSPTQNDYLNCQRQNNHPQCACGGEHHPTSIPKTETSENLLLHPVYYRNIHTNIQSKEIIEIMLEVFAL